MPGPKLRYPDGTERNQDSGTTLGHIRSTYPNCYLENGEDDHRLDTFVLQDGVTYNLKPPNVGNAGKY